MEKDARLEGEVVILGQQGGSYKAVAQSIPTYTMGVFQLPGKLYDELDAMCARFWWGQIGEERKIHWKNWSF